jgi:tetratricopeptide (TPR) repeat protein
MSAEAGTTALRSIIGTIFAPLFALLRFTADWWATREWRWLAIATPAIVVGSVVLVGFFQTRFASVKGLAAAYTKQAQSAVRAQEYTRAEMLYRKAATHRPRDPQLKFARAIVLDKMDRTPEAYSVMQSIAPLDDEDANSYGDAHLWIAQALLSKHVTDENPGVLANAHLNAILEKSPEHVEAHRIKTNLAINLGNGSAALKHFPFIVAKYPETRIIYARILEKANQTEEAMRQAKQAKDYYSIRFPERVVGETNPLTLGEWLDWASSSSIQNQFFEAVVILRRASSHVDNKSAIRQALAGVYVRWTKHIDEVNSPNISQQLQLLGQALQIAPDNPQVLERIALLIGRDGDADAIAENMLQDALVNGTAPAVVHFLLGTRAASNGDMEAAKSHLEQARLLNPNTPVVLNNLAWVLAGRGSDQMTTALEYANQAVKLQPYQANFRDTRGQIHIRLENWQEGIADLEEALRKLKGSEQIHTSLAKGYEALGRTDMAALHQTRVKEIQAKKKQTPAEVDDPEKQSTGA